MRFSDEHNQLRRTVRDFVEKEINPYIDEWEKAGAFPAHQLFKNPKFPRLQLDGGAIAQHLPFQKIDDEPAVFEASRLRVDWLAPSKGVHSRREFWK